MKYQFDALTAAANDARVGAEALNNALANAGALSFNKSIGELNGVISHQLAQADSVAEMIRGFDSAYSSPIRSLVNSIELPSALKASLEMSAIQDLNRSLFTFPTLDPSPFADLGEQLRKVIDSLNVTDAFNEFLATYQALERERNFEDQAPDETRAP